MSNLPKIALGAWAWGNDGTFGGDKTLVRYINFEDQGHDPWVRLRNTGHDEKKQVSRSGLRFGKKTVIENQMERGF